MKKLNPKDPDNRAEVISELKRAGIHCKEVFPSEYSFGVEGYLETVFGEITFVRCHSYWSVKGLFPLDFAEIVFNHPEGAYSIRAGGHCGKLHPKSQSNLLDKEGRDILKKSDYDKLSPSVKRAIDEKHFLIVDDAELDKYGNRFVKSYHVDSQAGLLLLVMLLKQA